ncbi:MAG: AMP-binding protein [bacterium]|nr:AMP-binding protein [bacterium]
MPRPLVRVPVAPGTAGVAPLLVALADALDGTGPAIAPVPAVSASISNSYVMSVLAAVRPEDPAAPLESDDVAVVMATSGSTGSPRGVLLTAGQLTAFAGTANASDTPPLWIVAIPVTSMGGMNVLVRALATGNDPIAMPSIGGGEPFTPRGFQQAVNVARARAADVRVALVPAQVARLLSDEAGVDALRECTSILVGGGPMRPSLREMAAELGISVTTTYGSTETSGGCVFDGIPLPGVTVAVQGDSAGPSVLLITSPSVASGYRSDPEMTREYFDDSTFITSDLGTVDADGRVHVLGRADDVVVINGVNVSPGAIERVLDDLPDVVTAAAVSIASAAGEPAIWVFLEVRDEAPHVESTAIASVVERLGAAARPRGVKQVARLPHLPNGKVDRRLLQSWARDEDGS